MMICPYCTKPMPPGLEPEQWQCCGEIGHAIDEIAMADELKRAARILRNRGKPTLADDVLLASHFFRRD